MTEKPPLGSTPPTPCTPTCWPGWPPTTSAGSPPCAPTGHRTPCRCGSSGTHGRLLVMSEPRTAKVTNVRRGSPALLHLHTRADGNGVVVLSGPAVISDRTAPQWLPEIGEAYTRQVRRGDGGLRHGAGGRSPRSSTSSSSSCPPTCRRGEASRTRPPELPVAAGEDAAAVRRRARAARAGRRRPGPPRRTPRRTSTGPPRGGQGHAPGPARACCPAAPPGGARWRPPGRRPPARRGRPPRRAPRPRGRARRRRRPTSRGWRPPTAPRSRRRRAPAGRAPHRRGTTPHRPGCRPGHPRRARQVHAEPGPLSPCVTMSRSTRPSTGSWSRMVYQRSAGRSAIRQRGHAGPHVHRLGVGHDERPARGRHQQADVLVGAARHERAQAVGRAGDPRHPAAQVGHGDDGRLELRRLGAHERLGDGGHAVLLRGMTTGAPDAGSVSTVAATPKTSSITSGVTTSAGVPSATTRPSRMATRWSA